jgi:hypothetical protein
MRLGLEKGTNHEVYFNSLIKVIESADRRPLYSQSSPSPDRKHERAKHKY